jgi:hypothetical protein
VYFLFRISLNAPEPWIRTEVRCVRMHTHEQLVQIDRRIEGHCRYEGLSNVPCILSLFNVLSLSLSLSLLLMWPEPNAWKVFSCQNTGKESSSVYPSITVLTSCYQATGLTFPSWILARNPVAKPCASMKAWRILSGSLRPSEQRAVRAVFTVRSFGVRYLSPTIVHLISTFNISAWD